MPLSHVMESKARLRHCWILDPTPWVPPPCTVRVFVVGTCFLDSNR